MSEYAVPVFGQFDMKTMEVEVSRDVWGNPKRITWWDGRTWDIDRLGARVFCPSRFDNRFTLEAMAWIQIAFIRIGNGKTVERALIEDHGKWFLEVRK